MNRGSNIFEGIIGDGQIKGSEPSFHDWEMYDPVKDDNYYIGDFWFCRKCGWDLGPVYDPPQDDVQRKVMIHHSDHSVSETKFYCNEFIAYQVMES